MGSTRKTSSFWRRLTPAMRLAVVATGSVVVLAVLCAGLAYRRSVNRQELQFEQHVAAAEQLTREVLLSDAPSAPGTLLQRYFQLEAREATLDYAAVIIGTRIEISHSRDWQGLEPAQVLGPATWEALTAMPPTGTLKTRENQELGRREALVVLPVTQADRPVLLYLAVDHIEIAAGAWGLAWATLRHGLMIAVGVGVVTYLGFQRAVGEPLARLQQHLDETGLPPELHSAQLGELGRLAWALEQATLRLLKDEGAKQEALSRRLQRTVQESEVQTGVLQHMVKDLRCSMSAVLGHAELLLASDTKASERINHIRSIQKEARRIARLVRELQDLLPPLASRVGTSEQAALPLDGFKRLIEELSSSGSATLHFSTPERRRTELPAGDDPGGVHPSGWRVAADEPAEPQRLSGAVLLLGRQDDGTRALLFELHELGLDAVWVPDLAAFDSEMARSGCDVVFVNLSRGDRSTRELAGALRAHYPDGPLVAVLPHHARGAGTAAVGEGLDDYLYAPINRPAILAVIGKYVGFKPLA